MDNGAYVPKSRLGVKVQDLIPCKAKAKAKDLTFKANSKDLIPAR